MVSFVRELMLSQAEWVRRGVEESLGLLVCLGLLLLAVALLVVVAALMAAPLRRRERARCFLDVLETGLAQGQSPEQTVVSLSHARVQTLGVWLHLVAAHVENGLRLGAALEKAPTFLPATVRAMLQAGEALGDVRPVLPACRAVLRRNTSAVQVTQNNLVAMLTVLPVGLAINWLCLGFVVPRFKEILADMLGYEPVAPVALFEWSFLLGWVIALLWLLLYAVECLPHLAPRWQARLGQRFWRLFQWLDFVLPWRRDRMRRDFSALLALLLDSGVPEARALSLAAAGTGNQYFIARANRVGRNLEKGWPLTEALRAVDNTGEFHWRLRNAARAGSGFVTALRGWHEALEAKAFQQEQTASNLLTAGFIFLNGFMVSLLTAGVFLVLLAIITEAPLW